MNESYLTKRNIQEIFANICKKLNINYVKLVFDKHYLNNDTLGQYFSEERYKIVNEKIYIHNEPEIEVNRKLINETLRNDSMGFGELKLDSDNVSTNNKIVAYALLFVHEITHAERDKECFKYNRLRDIETIGVTVKGVKFQSDMIRGVFHTKEFNEMAKINFEKCRPYLKKLGLEE